MTHVQPKRLTRHHGKTPPVPRLARRCKAENAQSVSWHSSVAKAIVSDSRSDSTRMAQDDIRFGERQSWGLALELRCQLPVGSYGFHWSSDWLPDFGMAEIRRMNWKFWGGQNGEALILAPTAGFAASNFGRKGYLTRRSVTWEMVMSQ